MPGSAHREGPLPMLAALCGTQAPRLKVAKRCVTFKGGTLHPPAGEELGHHLKTTHGLSIALLTLGAALVFLALPAAAESFDETPPAFDDNYYVPGEPITLTLTGMVAASGYDINIYGPNGSVVMKVENVTATAAGNYLWTFDIPADWDGGHRLAGSGPASRLARA